jgi:c-di-GMP-binding flagellar brake protein YcgR
VVTAQSFTEQRKSARKVLRVKAMIAMEGGAPVVGRTADVSANGVSVTAPNPLKVGQTGQVNFALFFDGQATTIRTRSKTLYCIFSNGEFKIGFEFMNIDLSAMTVLARFLR